MSENAPQPGSIDEKQFQAPAAAERYSKVADFIRITFSVLTGPRTFYAKYFQSINQSKQPLPNSLSTFKYLGLAIGITAVIAPLHRALLRAGGFPEFFLDLAERGSKGLMENYQRVTGQDLALIDLTQLTGVSLIDEPIEDTARMVIYALFAGLFWAFSGGKLPLKRMMGYFAYSIGACLVIETAFLLIGDVIFALLSPGDPQTNLFTMSAIHEVGQIPRLIYLFIMPTVIFPAILGIRRGTVLVATLLSVITWGLTGLLIAQIMMGAGIVIMAPGL
jgi:hypothetical protein